MNRYHKTPRDCAHSGTECYHHPYHRECVNCLKCQPTAFDEHCKICLECGLSGHLKEDCLTNSDRVKIWELQEAFPSEDHCHLSLDEKISQIFQVLWRFSEIIEQSINDNDILWKGLCNLRDQRVEKLQGRIDALEKILLDDINHAAPKNQSPSPGVSRQNSTNENAPKRQRPNPGVKPWELPHSSSNYRQRSVPQIYNTRTKTNMKDRRVPTNVSYTLFPNKRSSQTAPTTRHIGIGCDGCGQADFEGPRYKCTSCPYYDLCEKCYKNYVVTSSHTNEHPMRSIENPEPVPAPMNFVGYVKRLPTAHNIQEREPVKTAFVGKMSASSSVHPIASPKSGTKICALHGEQPSTRSHNTSECEQFRRKYESERWRLVNKNRICPLCLLSQHPVFKCRKLRPVDRCEKTATKWVVVLQK